jgi:hypothetical protein
MMSLEHLTPVKRDPLAKQNRKNIKKHWIGGSSISGERLYVDISSIQGVSFGGATFGALAVDDCSGYCWSYILRANSELKESILDLVKELKMSRFLKC